MNFKALPVHLPCSKHYFASTKIKKIFAQHRACRQPGPGGVRLVGARGARGRRVANGPKAPAGRFRPMPPRRPLVGGKGGAGRFD